MRSGSRSSRSNKSAKSPFALPIYCLLFASIFITIQFFLYGLFTCYTREGDPNGRWIVITSFALLVFSLLFFIRIKRNQVELYREEAYTLYIGAIIAIPIAQWLVHTYVFTATFERLGPYRHVEVLCMLVWLCVLVFNVITDLPGYDRNPNRKHWTCRLRRLFVGSPSTPRY